MATTTHSKPTDGKSASQPQARMFPNRHDLPVEVRQQLVGVLNQHLADVTDLRTQVKHAHWNVKGRQFIALHKLFDEQAERLDELGDEIAERATALGGLAVGPSRSVAKATRLPDWPLDVVDAVQVVATLADRYAVLAKGARQAIDQTDDLGDKDTADLFTEVSRVLDKDLWFLEAHLQSEG